MSDTLYIGNDHLLSVTLTGDDGAPITSGTVEATITDLSGDQVAGITWPVALAHTAAGVWEATFQSTLQIVDKRRYRVDIAAVQGTINGAWRKTVTAAYRDWSST